MTTTIVREETTPDNADIGDWLELDEVVAALDIRTWVLRMLAGGVGADSHEHIIFSPAAVTRLAELLEATVPGYGDIPPARDMRPELVRPFSWGPIPDQAQPGELYYWRNDPAPGTLALRSILEGSEYAVAPTWTESTTGEISGIQRTEVGEVVAVILWD